MILGQVGGLFRKCLREQMRFLGIPQHVYNPGGKTLFAINLLPLAGTEIQHKGIARSRKFFCFIQLRTGIFLIKLLIIARFGVKLARK